MDCPYIPELSYGDFSKRLRQNLAGRRVPLVGSLELTFRCNLRCEHCYLSYGHNGLPGHQELTTDEIKDLLDEVVDAGCLWFLFTGGEPFVRRDFMEIYTYAKHKGLILTLFTNGTLLTPRMADFLAEWRPFSVEITLYGYTQETYERVTGIPGSHARCINGIEMLLERKIPLKLKTMAMTLNSHEVWQMQEYAESLGVDFRFDGLLNGGLGGVDKPKDLRLSPREVVDFDLDDPKRMQSWEEFCDKFLIPPDNNSFLYKCGAGLNSFHIDPYGNLSPCMIARGQEFDLRQDSFQDGWEVFLADLRSQPSGDGYTCGSCRLQALCGQCPGWGELEHGDPRARVDYICQVAHLRAKEFEFIQVE